MKPDNKDFINSVNLNIHTDFPYLILNVKNDVAVPRNPGFHVMHWHEDLQFIYVLEGMVRVQTLEESVLLHAGEGIFINKNVVHLVEKIEECCYKSFLFPDYFVSFYMGSPAAKLTAAFTANPQITVVFLGNETWHTAILEHLRKLISLEESKMAENRDDFYCYEVLATLSSMWLILLKNIHTAGGSVDSVVSKRMHLFLQYINDRFAEEITLEGLAESAHVSKSECLRCFRESLQTTPYRYLMDFRLSKATKLLTETDLPVSEIASCTGFHGQSYFGKCFREKMNCTPREYRARK